MSDSSWRKDDRLLEHAIDSVVDKAMELPTDITGFTNGKPVRVIVRLHVTSRFANMLRDIGAIG